MIHIRKKGEHKWSRATRRVVRNMNGEAQAHTTHHTHNELRSNKFHDERYRSMDTQSAKFHSQQYWDETRFKYGAMCVMGGVRLRFTIHIPNNPSDCSTASMLSFFSYVESYLFRYFRGIL